MRPLRVLSVVLVAAGCGSGGDACGGAVAMASVQATVFDGCTTSSGACHATAPYAAGLDLTAGRAWTALVHAPSTSAPGQWRVEPSDVRGSFLWRKLDDELASDGSEGLPMPRDARDQWAPLGAAELEMVRCWIAGGAPAD